MSQQLSVIWASKRRGDDAIAYNEADIAGARLSDRCSESVWSWFSCFSKSALFTSCKLSDNV